MSGRIHAEFIQLLFLRVYREAEEHVKHMLGMNGVAAQPHVSDAYLKSNIAPLYSMPSSATRVVSQYTRILRPLCYVPQDTSPLQCNRLSD